MRVFAVSAYLATLLYVHYPACQGHDAGQLSYRTNLGLEYPGGFMDACSLWLS